MLDRLHHRGTDPSPPLRRAGARPRRLAALAGVLGLALPLLATVPKASPAAATSSAEASSEAASSEASSETVSSETVSSETSAATPGRSYRVFATRIGLVGDLTANGYVIRPRDHFVALPSRRGLSSIYSGNYTVRVCTTNGSRCTYAPVWDVGPWNTRDDYWNPPQIRQNWSDLPQGMPEAQAAHLYGYNGGRDEFGRVVLNPAGIDLADGTFWDALLLDTNAWVDVWYLWTGTGSRGAVGAGPLNLRAGPSTGYAIRGLAARYAQVPIECYLYGQSVAGPYGTTTRWNRVAAGQYVSHAYIFGVTGGAVPRC